MRKTFWATLILALFLPAAAGDIHGTVDCKVCDFADAVVYVETISGKRFPPPTAHAKMDQKSLKFSLTFCRCSSAPRSIS